MKTEKLKQQLFEEICHTYSKDLQRFIFTLTRKDYFAMEEIFQNTMLAGVNGLKKLRKTDKMKTWLFSIAKAETSRYYSKQEEITSIEQNYLQEDFLSLRMTDGIDITKHIESKEAIDALLNTMKEEEQQIFILHYFYDLPLKEISEITNIKYTTLRYMHSRGLEKLKKYYEGDM